MHVLDPQQVNADRFAEIPHVAKVRHASCERKLVHKPLASCRQVCDLARDPDTSFVECKAAHTSHGPIGSQVGQFAIFCLASLNHACLPHFEHFHMQDSSQYQILASSSVSDGESK